MKILKYRVITDAEYRKLLTENVQYRLQMDHVTRELRGLKESNERVAEYIKELNGGGH